MPRELQRTIVVAGAGTFARGFLPKLCEASAELGADYATLARGAVDFNRTASSTPLALGDGNQILDISPSPGEIKPAIGNLNSREVGERNRQFTRPVTMRMSQRIAASFRDADLADGQLICFTGFKTGHAEETKAFVEDVKQQRPRTFVTMVAAVPDEADKLAAMENGWEMIQELYLGGQIEGTIVLHNASPFVQSPEHTLDLQDEYIARALASLMAVQVVNPRAHSWTESVRSVVKAGPPFIGLAVASLSLVTGSTPFYWRWVRALAPKVSERGNGDFDNVLHTARRATEAALTDRSCWTFDEAPDASRPFFAVYVVPLRSRDRRWPIFANEIRSWLQAAYPRAVPLFVPGNGALNPADPSTYRLQVSLFYGLTTVASLVAPKETDDGLEAATTASDPLITADPEKGRRRKRQPKHEPEAVAAGAASITDDEEGW